MKKINLNHDWRFTFEADLEAYNTFGLLKYSDAANAAARFYDHSNWQKVDLPHDWAVALPKELWGDNVHGARANTHWHHNTSMGYGEFDAVREIGWYRKQFYLEESYADKRIFLEFEGVFRDATVWVNGVYIDRHASGYTGFFYEITDHLLVGEENSIAVRVDSEQHEGWWYEGAGIYRNVWLHVGEPVYFQLYQTVIKSEINGRVKASAVLVNDTERAVCEKAVWTVTDANGKTVATAETESCIPAYREARAEVELKIENPLLWHVDSPNLYTLCIQAQDRVEERFGIRSVEFDPDRGMLLNGMPLKLHGACNHHDFGGVGVALSDNLHRYKVQKLKEMGMNAVRGSHNPQAPAFLRACDELGVLVMDETRMFGTSPEALRQLTAMVERDRNHPSVILWSIGNEEFSVQNLDWSYRLSKKMMRLVRELDDTRLCTYGGCNGSDYTGINRAVDVRGINYIYNGIRKPGEARCVEPADGENWVDEYHRDHPEQPILGSEESSYVLGRGEARTDLGNGVLDCGGSVTMPWGATPKGWVKFYEKRPHLAGGFIWTGFDYRGEPNPYNFANHGTSFGTIDLCGMPKPPFYYYQSCWLDQPVLKLTPHWNYTEGEEARITVYTNCERVTLTLNGKLLGVYTVEPLEDLTLTVPFEAGTLRAEGTWKGQPCADELRTAGAVHAVACQTVLRGTCEEDIGIVELRAVDENGVLCPLCDDVVELNLPVGSIVGVGNGDPSDMDYEQKPMREEVRYVRSFDCDGALFEVLPKTPNLPSVSLYHHLERKLPPAGFEDDYRQVVMPQTESGGVTEKRYVAHVRGVKGYEYLEFERLDADVTVYVNGQEVGNNQRSTRDKSVRYTRPYRFACNFTDGPNEIVAVASMKAGQTRPFSGYVKIGRTVNEPWRVRLHYGLARVFVRSENPDSLQAVLTEN